MRACCAAPAAPPEFNRQSLFALGASDTNVCPSETFPVPSSASCLVAAAIAGKPYGGSVNAVSSGETELKTIYYMPAGCVWYSVGGSFYFNTATPSGDFRVTRFHYAYSQPVCAGAPRFQYRRQRSECVRERACVFVSPPTATHIQIVK